MVPGQPRELRGVRAEAWIGIEIVAFDQCSDVAVGEIDGADRIDRLRRRWAAVVLDHRDQPAAFWIRLRDRKAQFVSRSAERYRGRGIVSAA